MKLKPWQRNILSAFIIIVVGFILFNNASYGYSCNDWNKFISAI